MINIRLVLVCLFYFLGCYLWYEHSPFPDLHKWTYKMQAVYYILPLQVLFLFFFFRYHAWMAICFSLLPAWLFLLFIFCITKKRGKFPKKRTFYKAFVCALSAALVIPSLYIVGVIVFHVPKKQEKTTEENTSVFDDYRLLQYDEEAVYKENENQKLFSNFRQSHWELCSTQRKIEFLQELADFEARENLHIPEVKVYGETLPEIISSIRNHLKENRLWLNKFDLNLQKYGYFDGLEKNYSTGYHLREMNYYIVKDKFPRIEKKQLPEGISNCLYHVAIDNCKGYIVESKDIERIVKGGGQNG